MPRTSNIFQIPFPFQTAACKPPPVARLTSLRNTHWQNAAVQSSHSSPCSASLLLFNASFHLPPSLPCPPLPLPIRIPPNLFSL